MLIPAFRPGDEVTITYVGGTTLGTDTNTYTFTNHAIGTAAVDRVVLVTAAVGDASAFTFGTPTIGGANAATVVQAASSVGQYKCIIFGLWVPAGTTATIVVPLATGAGDRCRIAVFALTGTRGLLTAFATNTDNAGGNVMSATLNIPENGGAIGVAIFADSTAGLTGATWVGLTENEDQTVEIANQLVTSASSSNMVAETGRTISATSNLDADLGSSMAVASFAPA